MKGIHGLRQLIAAEVLYHRFNDGWERANGYRLWNSRQEAFESRLHRMAVAAAILRHVNLKGCKRVAGVMHTATE